MSGTEEKKRAGLGKGMEGNGRDGKGMVRNEREWYGMKGMGRNGKGWYGREGKEREGKGREQDSTK